MTAQQERLLAMACEPVPRKASALPGTYGYSLASGAERELFCAEVDRRGGPVLEIGSFQGATIAHVADRFPSVPILCVDTFECDHPGVALVWLANRRPNCTLFVGTSADLAPYVIGVEFAVAWIDGGHDYPSCLADLQFAVPALTPGGCVIVHDYTARCFPGIRQACGEVIGRAPDQVADTAAMWEAQA